MKWLFCPSPWRDEQTQFLYLGQCTASKLKASLPEWTSNSISRAPPFFSQLITLKPPVGPFHPADAAKERTTCCNTYIIYLLLLCENTTTDSIQSVSGLSFLHLLLKCLSVHLIVPQPVNLNTICWNNVASDYEKCKSLPNNLRFTLPFIGVGSDHTIGMDDVK